MERDRERDRERERETDRQTDRQTDRDRCREIDREIVWVGEITGQTLLILKKKKKVTHTDT